MKLILDILAAAIVVTIMGVALFGVIVGTILLLISLPETIAIIAVLIIAIF